jgi:hypothetical protein
MIESLISQKKHLLFQKVARMGPLNLSEQCNYQMWKTSKVILILEKKFKVIEVHISCEY